MTSKIEWFRVAGSALGLAFVLGGTPAFAADSDAGWHPDAWITTKAKIALLTTENVRAMDVNVDTIDGRVTLHGKVPDEKGKRAAAQAVRDIAGVREVTDLLQVVEPAAQEQVNASDSVIKTGVQKALADRASLKNSDITVQSVNSGVVLLAGKAPLDDQLLALQVASSVPGVKRVGTEMTGPDGETMAAADGANSAAGAVKSGAHKASEKTSEAVHSTKEAVGEAASNAGGAVQDAWITTKVKTRLLADNETPALDVNVDTNDGVVTLFGSVDSPAAKAAVEREAREADGVKSVRNLLQVVPKADQEKVASSDKDIENRIESELGNRKQFGEADIDVAVENGVVRLSGKAPTTGIRLSAATVARGVPGVKSVQNDIQLATDKG